MLRAALVSACLCFVALLPGTAHAGPWRYAFKPGSTQSFHYSGTDDVNVQLPMVGGINQHLVVDTDFTMKVLKRLPDGRADVEVRLDKVVITGDGAPTTLGKLPGDMQVLRAYVTPRGHFEFYRRVVVEVLDDGGYALGSLTASPTGASGSATVNGEQVTATASIDPKTGRVSASITHRPAPPPSSHQEVRREPTQVDVLPARVLSLMELPEGPVSDGDAFSMDLPSMKVEGRGLPVEPCGKASCGKLTMRGVMDGSMGAAVQTAGAMGMPADDQADMQQQMAEANAQMGGAMGMAGMPGMGGAGGGAPQLSTSFDVELLFNEAAGALSRVTGSVDQVTSMGPMKVVAKSVFSLHAK
jgi:hypothetical protein